MTQALDLEHRGCQINFQTKPSGQNLHYALTGQKFVKSFVKKLVKSLLFKNVELDLDNR
jgi:hypothetical protein